MHISRGISPRVVASHHCGAVPLVDSPPRSNSNQPTHPAFRAHLQQQQILTTITKTFLLLAFIFPCIPLRCSARRRSTLART